MMKRTSKYVGKTFGNWICTDINIANVQGAKSKRPGKQNYSYLFERRTSDGVCDKLVILNSSEAAAVGAGKKLVEEIADGRKKNEKTRRKIAYRFI